MRSADRRFEYRDREDAGVAPGTAAADVHRIAFRCRRKGAAPDEMCSLNLRGRGHDREKRSWTWDGNVDKPTLAPSINCQSCCWHGFIEAGVFNDTSHRPEKDQRP